MNAALFSTSHPFPIMVRGNSVISQCASLSFCYCHCSCVNNLPSFSNKRKGFHKEILSIKRSLAGKQKVRSGENLTFNLIQQGRKGDEREMVVRES